MAILKHWLFQASVIIHLSCLMRHSLLNFCFAFLDTLHANRVIMNVAEGHTEILVCITVKFDSQRTRHDGEISKLVVTYSIYERLQWCSDRLILENYP